MWKKDMASTKKPPWFAQQQPDGPIPLASFEEDLYDTASEATVSPESECQNEVPPLPSAKRRPSSDTDDMESQEGTLTPKSPTTQSKDDSFMSSRDELSNDELGSTLTSPKTPTARGPSPLSSFFKWRGSPKKFNDASSPSAASPSENLSSPICSTSPKSPKSPRWKREGKAFLSFFKFGDKKQKKRDKAANKFDSPEGQSEPDLISSTKISSASVPMQSARSNAIQEIPSPSSEDVENIDTPLTPPEESACDLTREVMEVIGAMREEHEKSEEQVASSDGEEHLSEDVQMLHAKRDSITEVEVDHEAQNLLSQESLEYDDTIEDNQILAPRTTKSEPITPTRRQRLEVVTIPVERPRSTTPMSVAPLEAFIVSINSHNSEEKQEKIKLSLPGDEFGSKQKAKKTMSTSSWVNFCKTGLQSPRAKKRAGQSKSACVLSDDAQPFTWTSFDRRPSDQSNAQDLPSDEPNVQCNCDCSKLSSSEIASLSFDDDRVHSCRCLCHNGSTDLCECNCRTLINSLQASAVDCCCVCHSVSGEYDSPWCDKGGEPNVVILQDHNFAKFDATDGS